MANKLDQEARQHRQIKSPQETGHYRAVGQEETFASHGNRVSGIFTRLRRGTGAPNHQRPLALSAEAATFHLKFS